MYSHVQAVSLAVRCRTCSIRTRIKLRVLKLCGICRRVAKTMRELTNYQRFEKVEMHFRFVMFVWDAINAGKVILTIVGLVMGWRIIDHG